MEFLDLRNEVCTGQEFTPVQEPTDPLDHDLGCGFGGTFRAALASVGLGAASGVS
jgi:hypothetical protein